MTREEAKEIIYYSSFEKGKYGLTKDNIFKLINRIYDDFESRVCKNCKYYNPAHKVCENRKNIQPFEIDNKYVNIFTDGNFGCNRFERKEDERK